MLKHLRKQTWGKLSIGWFLPFLMVLFLFSGCSSLQDLLTPIYVTAGFESSSIRFTTDKATDPSEALARQLSPEVIRSPITGLRTVISQSAKDTGFYTIRSIPNVVSKSHWLGRFFAYSLTLDSPRIFRGELLDYPDKGFVPKTWEEIILAQTIPRNDLTSRRMDYIYEETRAYATAYVGYFDTQGFSLALGINYGQIKYNLTLIENRYRVSEVLGSYRPMLSTTIMMSYAIGKYFPGTVAENTFFYLEATSENNNRYPVQTQVLKSDGTSPPSLFLESNFFRIGIIKEIHLISSKRKDD